MDKEEAIKRLTLLSEDYTLARRDEEAVEFTIAALRAQPEPKAYQAGEWPAGVDPNDPERMSVQLAGISFAANGGTEEDLIVRRGDYGWSPPYQDVLELRHRYDALHHAIDSNPQPELSQAPVATAPEYCFSTDGENYTLAVGCTSHEEALAECIHGYDPEPGTGVRTGLCDTPTISHFNDLAEDLLDRLQERAQEDSGDHAESWLKNVTAVQCAELDAALDTTLEEWASRHGKQPTFFKVEQVREHVVPGACPECGEKLEDSSHCDNCVDEADPVDQKDSVIP